MPRGPVKRVEKENMDAPLISLAGRMPGNPFSLSHERFPGLVGIRGIVRALRMYMYEHLSVTEKR